MRYISSRGGAQSTDFEGALFSGYAADGGLFMPEKIPNLDFTTLQTWSTFSYPELVKQLCTIFISPELIHKTELNDLIDRAFSRFRHKDVVHMSRLKNGLNVLELWHGPTYAFKDLSLSCTGQFLQYFLKKRKEHVTILVGTSGDTGSSAIESVHGQKNVDICVLLPHGLCSQVQELQMTTVMDENVHVFLTEGNSDEIDQPIKELFADEEFSRRHNLMSLNSINWSRILVQMAHYFYAYFQCVPVLDALPLPVVEIVVPTGAAGNLTAGCIAQKMGLPIELVAVVNDNDIIHRTIQQGDFSLSRAVTLTLASAMDIQEPYNMERIFWLFSGSDSSLVKKLMEEFYTTRSVKLPSELQKKLSEGLRSCTTTDEEILQAMRCCWEENGYLLCPHSAVAACYHYKHLACHPRRKVMTQITNKVFFKCFFPIPEHWDGQEFQDFFSIMCCLAPASPVKFENAVSKARIALEMSPEISMLKNKKTKSYTLKRGEDWAEILRHRIEAITKQHNPVIN